MNEIKRNGNNLADDISKRISAVICTYTTEHFVINSMGPVRNL